MMGRWKLHAVADAGEGGDQLSRVVGVELGTQAADPGAQLHCRVTELQAPDAT